MVPGEDHAARSASLRSAHGAWYAAVQRDRAVLHLDSDTAGIELRASAKLCSKEDENENDDEDDCIAYFRKELLVYRLANNGGVVAFKMGRRQGARRAHI